MDVFGFGGGDDSLSCDLLVSGLGLRWRDVKFASWLGPFAKGWEKEGGEDSDLTGGSDVAQI